jgi:nicotinamidase-related amidase
MAAQGRRCVWKLSVFLRQILHMKNILLTLSLLICSLAGVAQKPAPARVTALLIIDIQNDYFENGKLPLVGSLEASEKAKAVLENFRKKSLPVIHVRHVSSQSGGLFSPDGKGIEFHSSVAPLPGEKVVTKSEINSFQGTDLLDYLKSKGITDLVICGMMTHMCIDAATRAASDYGFSCTLISDACATRDLKSGDLKVQARDVQAAFLAALNGNYAQVIPAGAYLK